MVASSVCSVSKEGSTQLTTEKMILATAIEQQETSTNNKDRLPAVNECVYKRYLVRQVIGEGGYGTVLSVIDIQTKKNYAIKTEKYSRSMLHVEVSVLRAARDQRCKHFAKIIDQGSIKREYVFIVMTLLGRDLNKLRNHQPQRHFSPPTAIRVASQTLEAIKELHSLGFLSRDIKPGNFVIGRGEDNKTIFLIDFGLSRKFVTKTGSVMPSRGEMGWRGTARYGSLQAHIRQDLGRKDDIESWLYMSIELYKGTLPWRLIVDRAQIRLFKLEHRKSHRSHLFESCPPEYDEFLKQIDSWQFEDEPKYDDFLLTLKSMFNAYSTVRNAYIPYDWEDTQQRNPMVESDRAQRRYGGGSYEPSMENCD